MGLNQILFKWRRIATKPNITKVPIYWEYMQFDKITDILIWYHNIDVFENKSVMGLKFSELILWSRPKPIWRGPWTEKQKQAGIKNQGNGDI